MDRFTWGIVAGALLLVVAGLASVTLLQRPPPAPDLSTPEGVVRAYVEAMDGGRPERAWDLLADSVRSEVSRDEFIRRATSFRPRSSRVAMESVDVQGSVARVELGRTYNGDGLFGPASYTNRVTVRLEREAGHWRISVPPEPHLVPRPAAPPPPRPTTSSATPATLAYRSVSTGVAAVPTSHSSP